MITHLVIIFGCDFDCFLISWVNTGLNTLYRKNLFGHSKNLGEDLWKGFLYKIVVKLLSVAPEEEHVGIFLFSRTYLKNLQIISRIICVQTNEMAFLRLIVESMSPSNPWWSELHFSDIFQLHVLKFSQRMRRSFVL